MYSSKAVFWGEVQQIFTFTGVTGAGSHGPGINPGRWKCGDLAGGSSYDCCAWTKAALFALRPGRAFFDRDLVRAASVELSDVAGWFPGYSRIAVWNPSGGCCNGSISV